MNKYIIIIIVLVLIIAGGFGYSKFIKKDSELKATGETKEFVLHIKKLEWRFDPEVIEVNQGDKVDLTIINEDNFDHGITVEAFGINQRIPANGTIHLSFTASQVGEFTYYCSVPCGGGEVNGVKRGHFDQFGKIKVRASTTNQ